MWAFHQGSCLHVKSSCESHGDIKSIDCYWQLPGLPLSVGITLKLVTQSPSSRCVIKVDPRGCVTLRSAPCLPASASCGCALSLRKSSDRLLPRAVDFKWIMKLRFSLTPGAMGAITESWSCSAGSPVSPSRWICSATCFTHSSRTRTTASQTRRCCPPRSS